MLEEELNSQSTIADSGGSNVESQPKQPLPLSSEEIEEDEDVIFDETESNSQKYCVRCNKTLLTLGGFKRHKFLHVYKDALARISVKDINDKAPAISEETLSEMLSDEVPGDFGEARKMFINRLLSSTVQPMWCLFVDKVTDDLLEIILLRNTRVLPAKQYQENLTFLNEYLSNAIKMSVLEDFFKQLSPSEDPFMISSCVYRFCFLYFKSLKVLSLQMMQRCRVAQAAPAVQMSKSEKQTLYYASGSTLRHFLKKATKADQHSQWQLRLSFMKERLLFDQNEKYSEEFYELKEWYDKCDRGGLIAVNEKFFKFLFSIEVLIRKIVSENVSAIQEEVVNRIFDIDNRHILEMWYELSAYILPESESILFSEMMVKQFVKFSASAEGALVLRTTEKKKKKTVALRTGLKRD